MTLVFVASQTIPALKDAIVAGRTAVWFEDKVIGREEYLEALFEAAISISDIEREEKAVRFTIRNGSDLSVQLQRTGKMGPRELNLPANAVARIRVGVDGKKKPVELAYMATNFLVGPDKGLPVDFVIAGQYKIKVEVEVPDR